MRLIVALFLTHRSEPQTNIPVTGVDVTAQQSTNTEETQEQPVTETAPTEFTLRYEVAEGSESYIEVYVDDEVQESSTVDGPANNLTLRRELSDLFPLKRVGLPFILTMKQ